MTFASPCADRRSAGLRKAAAARGSDRFFLGLVALSALAHLGLLTWGLGQRTTAARFAFAPAPPGLQIGYVELLEPPPVVPPEPAPPAVAPPPPPPPLPPVVEPVEAEPTPVVPAEPPEAPPTTPPAESPPVAAAVPSPPPTPAPAGSEGASEADTAEVVWARPDYLANPPPQYPRLARERGWEGTTVLRVEVRADGTPGAIQILRSSGYRLLDQAAVSSVRGWRFVPARRGTEPVDSWARVPIRFELTDD